MLLLKKKKVYGFYIAIIQRNSLWNERVEECSKLVIVGYETGLVIATIVGWYSQKFCSVDISETGW